MVKIPSKLEFRLARTVELANRRINFGAQLLRNQPQRSCHEFFAIQERYKECRDVRDTLLRLVQNEIIADTEKDVFQKYCMSVLQQKLKNEDFYGVNKRDWIPEGHLDPKVKKVLEYMASGKSGQMRKEIVYRCAEAAIDAYDNDWFVIMDTLTLEHHYRIDPQEVLGTDGWRKYKERFCYNIAKSVYGDRTKARKARRDDYIGYCATVEHGKNGDNPHIHVLWFCRNVPDSWKRDPNSGLRLPIRREIDPAKDLWEYGFSTPVAVRLHPFDAWGKLGFVWPIDKKTKTPIPCYGPAGAGAYIAKYIGKEVNVKWRTRIRISHNLGKRRITEAIRKLPTCLLRPLSKCSLLPSIGFSKTPTTLWKRLSVKERLRRASPKLALMCRLSTKKRAMNFVKILNTTLREVTGADEKFLLRSALDTIRISAGVYERRVTAAKVFRAMDESLAIKFTPMNGMTGYARF